MEIRDRIFIDGKWQPSLADGSIDVIEAATEGVIGSTPNGNVQDVDRAVNSAKDAFENWSMTPHHQRAEFLTLVAKELRKSQTEIAASVTREVGHPFVASQAAQTAAIANLDVMASAVHDICWEDPIDSALVVREPIGVVGAITPWNAPLHQVTVKVGAALAAGCTVVLKPSEIAPLTAFVLAEAFEAIGLPNGVFNLVSGVGPVVGEALAAHSGVDMISFTGSLRAGKRVMELGSATVKRVSLELGGKSPNIILSGTDLQTAITDGVDDCFRNAGQVCAALSRLLVPRELLKDSEDIAVARAEEYIVGDPFDKATLLGPVATANQRDRVRNYIEKGIAEGAKLLTGGPEIPPGLERGYFVRPTIFSDVRNQMIIAREEIFGPVICILPFDSEEEAIEIANDSQYGLAAGVWSSDLEHSERVARKLRVGRVRINGGPLNRLAPHGGYKQSGNGREWGRFGIEDFLEVKSLLR